MTSPARRTPTRREYQSPLRRTQAERTRATVLDAATRLFAEHGWAATGVRDVAREAGVSVETVYASVGTKPELLAQAIDVAIVGDDEPVALTERPEFRAMSTGDLHARIEASAALNATVHARTVGLLRALREGAGRDAGLAARLAAAHAGHRATVRAGLAAVAGRELGDTEADGLWALLGWEVFDLLTGTAGWTTEQYRQWLAGVVERLLDTTTQGGDEE